MAVEAVTLVGRHVDLARRGLIELVVFGLLPATAYTLRTLGRYLSR